MELLRNSGIGYWTEINIVVDIVIDLISRWRIDSNDRCLIEFRHHLRLIE
jgi:hypothetical protein